MQIGEVIRKYRRQVNLTQEQMAERLGVSAPAVNKWERGRTLPDVALLAPIARLLGITTDELLSYRDALTAEEVDAYLQELNVQLEHQSFAEAFDRARQKMRQYPNCEQLALQACQLLNAWHLSHDGAETTDFEAFALSTWQRLLESQDRTIRDQAAESLYFHHFNAGNYHKAEEYLALFDEDDPKRRKRQADICAETGRGDEAAKVYEELLYEGYQRLNEVAHGMYLMALRAQDMPEARYWADKLSALARTFEMGEYHEISMYLEIATTQQDAEAVLALAERMLENAESIMGFAHSRMYRHMQFRPASGDYIRWLRKGLVAAFRDDESCGFMRENPAWEALLRRFKSDGDEGYRQAD